MIYGLHKAGLEALDPDTRAFTLVGAFMGFFSLLEAGINSAIQEMLGVKGMPGAIVTRNMTFDEKIKTLRTLVDAIVLSAADAKEFDSLAVQARKIGEKRNVIAHTPFRRSETSDGVEFFVMTANSSLKFPKWDWSIDEFLGELDNINDTDNALRKIEQKIGMQRVAAALREGKVTSGAGLLGLGSLFGVGEGFLDQPLEIPDESVSSEAND